MTKFDYYKSNKLQLQGSTSIFVFGSNIEGIHGAGAAKEAKEKYGAMTGIGQGFVGRSYALPTKLTPWQTLDLTSIKAHIDDFNIYARLSPMFCFYVTKVGCGLAGYKDHQIAPLFKDSPENCIFHIDWQQYLEENNA